MGASHRLSTNSKKIWNFLNGRLLIEKLTHIKVKTVRTVKKELVGKTDEFECAWAFSQNKRATQMERPIEFFGLDANDQQNSVGKNEWKRQFRYIIRIKKSSQQRL